MKYQRTTTASRRYNENTSSRFAVMSDGPNRKFIRAFRSKSGKQRAFISPTGHLFYVSKHFEARVLRRKARIRKFKELRS